MYYNSEFASVEWNDEVKVAVLTWKKFAYHEFFREPCQKALELAIAKKAQKWYSDTTLLGVLKQEDTQWFMDEIVQGMLAHGITKQALIVPQSILSKWSLTKAGEMAEQLGLETKFFSNKTEALQWLQS